MSSDSIQSLVAQMKVMSDLAAGQVAPAAPTVNADGHDFQSLLKQAVSEVNQAQNTAQAKVQAFSTGESNMTLEEVMVSLQKANLSFQQMVQVRNKLVTAYQNIMNMQV